MIAEDPDGSPFTGQRQVRGPVTVQVAEDRSRNQAHSGQGPGVGRIQFKTPGSLEMDTGVGRGGVSSWQQASSDEEVESTVAVNIGHGQRARAGFFIWEREGLVPAAKIQG